MSYWIEGPAPDTDGVEVSTRDEAVAELRKRGVDEDTVRTVGGTPRDAYIGHELDVADGVVCIEGAEVES